MAMRWQRWVALPMDLGEPGVEMSLMDAPKPPQATT